MSPLLCLASAPLAISIVSLLLAAGGVVLAFRSYRFARREYFSARTFILTCTMRPKMDPEFEEYYSSADPEKRKTARRLWVEGHRNKGLIVFKPSMKPNTVLNLTFHFPTSVTPMGTLEMKNVFAGDVTAAMVERGWIKDGDIASPALFFCARLDSWLRKLTPERCRSEYGTLNVAALPVVVDLDLIANGQRAKERQHYEMELNYQVGETGETVVQQVGMTFLKRGDPGVEPLPELDAMMPSYGIRFLSDPPPARSTVGLNGSGGGQDAPSYYSGERTER